MPRTRTRTDLTLPTGEDTALALEASRVLEQRPAADAGLRLQIAGSTGKSTTLDLPAPAAQLLRTILKELGAGNAVTVLPVEAEITTQQAADLLNVSRPFLVGLIEAGTLPRTPGDLQQVPRPDGDGAAVLVRLRS